MRKETDKQQKLEEIAEDVSSSEGGGGGGGEANSPRCLRSHFWGIIPKSGFLNAFRNEFREISISGKIWGILNIYWES